ncbi:MAG: DUF1178 family protein [Deltaproteobacteria bacterium]|nr:DUF1178 family protein [Deltaproteobacteria bacterium]
MIIYQLACAAGHQFEGWFPSSQAYEKQRELGIVHCSVCGIDAVERVPAGGHVGSSKGLASRSISKPKQTEKALAHRPKMDELTANIDPVTLVKMVDHYIRRNFKDVGNDFAKKAVDMHEGKEKEEPIFGTATEAEKEVLETKGVPFSSLPKLPESTEN